MEEHKTGFLYNFACHGFSILLVVFILPLSFNFLNLGLIYSLISELSYQVLGNYSSNYQ